MAGRRVTGAEGSGQSHEITVGGFTTVDPSAETLELTMRKTRRPWSACNAIWFRRIRRRIAGAGVSASGAGLNGPLKDMRRGRLTSLVWRRGCPCTAVWSLPVRCDVAPDRQPGRGHYARPLHAGIRAHPRQEGRVAAIPPRPFAARPFPPARGRPGSRDDPSADDTRRQPSCTAAGPVCARAQFPQFQSVIYAIRT